MKTIYPVKIYNRKGEQRYNEDVRKWHEGERTSQPFLGMYQFRLDQGQGELRKNGYVIADERGSQFILKRKDLEVIVKDLKQFQVYLGF